MGKQEFYLTKRHLPSGNIIWYYYYYDKFGERTTPKTTGCRKKADALNYCIDLLRKNCLYKTDIVFKNYTFDFFKPNSNWYNDNVLTHNVSEGTVVGYLNYFNNHILPYFSEMTMNKITPVDIKEFRVYLATKRKLANKTINNIIGVLRVIFNWAIEENIIMKSPITHSIKKLPAENKREAFSYEEIISLLSGKWNNYQAWLMILTAAVTGMRFSELLGLQPHQIKENYIDVCQQYYLNKLKLPKGNFKRFVMLPEKLKTMLLDNSIGNHFVFHSINDFSKPIAKSVIDRNFKSHFTQQMLKETEKRCLAFHSLRHFCNTYFISNNINTSKVNFVIGHSEGRDFMTRLYTTWKPEMYKDLLNLQTELLQNIIQETQQNNIEDNET